MSTPRHVLAGQVLSWRSIALDPATWLPTVSLSRVRGRVRSVEGDAVTLELESSGRVVSLLWASMREPQVHH